MSTTLGTIREAFEELLRRLELDPTRVARASQRYGSVKNLIETSLTGKMVAQVGSFQRKTKIRPSNPHDSLDVDAIVCFGDAHRWVTDGTGLSPSTALETIRRALASDKTYRLMEPKSDAPTVVLEYADGFKIELIPCFRDKTGTYPRPEGPACYLVGKASGGWVASDYDYDANVITGINQAGKIRGALVPSIKMIKAFLRDLNLGLRSFHVEILVALVVPTAIADWESRNLKWGYQHVLAYFLSSVGARMSGPANLPGSYSVPVDSGLSGLDLMTKGVILGELGKTAWQLCERKDSFGAFDGWGKFFGEPFPGWG